MKIKNYLKKLLPILDIALLMPVAIVAPIFKFYARVGGRRLPKCREYLKSAGIYPIRDHYYQPLFNDSRLKKSLKKPRSLPGVDWQTEKQIAFLNQLNHENELVNLRLNEESADLLKFSIKNEAFGSGDAEFLYQLIRYVKPRNIIEIGSGHSTKIAHLALSKNCEEAGFKALHTCIEPYEMEWLEDLGITVNRSLVEDCDLKMFEELKTNDILFIDSSHIIRPQGDVLTEYLQIIPKLQSGVIVHVHDIFSPRDYLDEWIRENVLFWNEQYLLEAIMSNTSRYEIVAALNYLHHNHFEALRRACPYLTEKREPGSFYFRVK
jgi:hypothetical protein